MAGHAAGFISTVGIGAGRVEVRYAGLRDMLALQALQRRCFPENQAYGAVTLLALYVWPRAQILSAWAGDRLAGCAVGDTNGRQARILNLCVDPDFRRQHIGRTLLESAEAVLGAGDVTLMVESTNQAAQALYRHAGYLPVSELYNYYGRDRHGILMQKRRG